MRLLTILTVAMIAAAPLARAAENAPPAAAPAAEYKYKTPRLDRARFDALLAKPGNLLIIDVRRPDEVTAIGGFPVYLSVQSDSVEKSLAFIPKGRTIVTVSNHAHRAGAAGDVLTAHGFKVAGAIGVEDYAAAGGTVTKIAPPAKAAEAAGSTQAAGH